MKAKDAHNSLTDYAGDDLYQPACQLYRDETNNRIELRARGKKPSIGVVEGIVMEMKDWFRKVAEGLDWEDPEVPEHTMKWESSATYVRYKLVDPVVEDYGKRSRLEVVKGTPLSLLEALTPDALDAVGGMMIAKAQEDVRRYTEELEKKREEAAQRLGKRVCPHGYKERFCKHQETYSISTELLPTDIDELVFVCTTDKCIKETDNGGIHSSG